MHGTLPFPVSRICILHSELKLSLERTHIAGVAKALDFIFGLTLGQVFYFPLFVDDPPLPILNIVLPQDFKAATISPDDKHPRLNRLVHDSRYLHHALVRVLHVQHASKLNVHASALGNIPKPCLEKVVLMVRCGHLSIDEREDVALGNMVRVRLGIRILFDVVVNTSLISSLGPTLEPGLLGLISIAARPQRPDFVYDSAIVRGYDFSPIRPNGDQAAAHI
mmetsp:Transcript_13994/g.28679  ORF Transcript_13994/g.28679 Transcript_13994/m.28679 type:complete len:222 (-) Transcript_13994:1113-1778(-)